MPNHYLAIHNYSSNSGSILYKDSVSMTEAPPVNYNAAGDSRVSIEVVNLGEAAWVYEDQIFNNDNKMTLLSGTTPGERNWGDAGVIVMEYNGSGDAIESLLNSYLPTFITKRK